MADRPILFSAPMVRAIIREIERPGTGKTQTRRILKPLPNRTIFFDAQKAGLNQHQSPRIKSGDRLYVREHWNTEEHYDDLAPSQMGGEEPVKYKADGRILTHGFPAMQRDVKHRQAMHMPRWASRLTLIVDGVKVERLLDISEEDARAEGVEYGSFKAGDGWALDGDPEGRRFFSARDAYAALWDHINGSGAWEANPWVAAYTFRPILGNIDQIGGEA